MTPTTPNNADGSPRVVLHAVVRRDVHFTMVRLQKGWTRVGRAYATKETAESWLDFVSKAWGDRPAEVSTCTLTFVNGQLDEESRRTLDETYNMDAPNNGSTVPGARGGVVSDAVVVTRAPGTVPALVGNVRQVCSTCAHWRVCLNYEDEGHCVSDGEQSPPIITDAWNTCFAWVANAPVVGRERSERTHQQEVRQ